MIQSFSVPPLQANAAIITNQPCFLGCSSFVGALLLPVHRWNSTSDGYWLDSNNWDTAQIPSPYSSVILPPQTIAVTVILDADVNISSLTLSSNVELLFTHNSTLTISGELVVNGGSFLSNLSSHNSFTSVRTFTMDSDYLTIYSLTLIVTGQFDWKRGFIDVDGFGELVLVNSTSFSSPYSDFSQDPNDVFVWGLNSNGLLGGDLQTSSDGISPESYALHVSIRQVSLGNLHSLVLSTNGDVYTAGSNIYGQLGYNGEGRTVHDKIELSNIIQVLSSHNSSFALTASGHVFSWGGNFNGELGLGDVIDRSSPSLIESLNTIKQIAGRHSTIFALTRDGKVFGWGNGVFNILCSQSSMNVLVPSSIEYLENIKFITASRAVFFTKEDGTTLTCGRKLGTSDESQPPFTQFASHIEFTFIDTTLNHALGIDVNQKLWSWGWNSDGRLGTGDEETSLDPVSVIEVGTVIAAATGRDHSIAVDVNNDVWSWGTSISQSLGRTTSLGKSHTPGKISTLGGKGITYVTAYQRATIAYTSIDMIFNMMTSSSNNGILTLEEHNLITRESNSVGIQQFNRISLPVFLSGTLNLSTDSIIFLSDFNSNGFLSINSPKETYFTSLILGASECSTLSLESNVFVETLYWFCGTIEGIGELQVNKLVLCSSNPELKLSRISIGKMMTSELNVEFNLTNDSILSINEVIEIPQLSFYSDLDVIVTFDGNFKLFNTSLTLRVDSHLNSNIELDQNSQIEIISSYSTLGSDFPLFLYYDWSNSPSGNDLSGNNNNVLEVSGAEWNPDGYYQFESFTDIIKIPNITFGWESATIAFSIWFDSDPTNRFGFSTNPSGCGLVIGDQLSLGDVTIKDLSIPRNQWISLIVTTDHSGAQMYINGALMASVNGNYDCDEFPDFFSLGSLYYKSGNDWVPSSDQFFKGRIRRVAVFSEKLSDIEVRAMSYTQFRSLSNLYGDGSIIVQNSSLLVNSLSTLSLKSLYSFNSSLFIVSSAVLRVFNSIVKDHSSFELQGRFLSADSFFPNLELDSSSFTSTTLELRFDVLSLSNGDFISDGYLEASVIHWFDGILTLSSAKVNVINLYGDDKVFLVESLTITEAVFFNSSLTLHSTNSQFSFDSVIVKCTPSSSLFLSGSLDVFSSELKFYNNFVLSEYCSFRSNFDISNYALFTLNSHSFSKHCYHLILPILFISKNTLILDSSDPDLFLYYNWLYSPSTIDLSGNHDLNAIIIDGPEWKRDSGGGYLDVAPGDTLYVPNILEPHGWRDASISLWIYIEEGDAGFRYSSPCRLHFSGQRLYWGSSITYDSLPMHQWMNLVFTFNQQFTRVYVNGSEIGDVVHPYDPYECSDGAPSYFPLSSVVPAYNTPFKGKYRAIQFYSRVLTEVDISKLASGIFQGLFGNGRLSFIDSSVQFTTTSFFLKSISLTSSILQSKGVIFEQLSDLELYDSVMRLSDHSKVRSPTLSFTLHSSELVCDHSVGILSSSFNVTAIYSRFQYDLLYFDPNNILNLSFSTLESSSDAEIVVETFTCYFCQVLGAGAMRIDKFCEIHSGNFSTSLIVLESVDTSLITGQVQLANSVDFFSHVILDDVSVSKFQSSSGSIICHSNVLMKHFVNISFVSFTFNDTLSVFDSTFSSSTLIVLNEYQTITGFGTIVTDISSFGRIYPSSTFTFEENLSLFPSSIVSLQIDNVTSFTQLIIGATAYLDGLLEIDFDTKSDSTSQNYTLIDSGQINGRFSSIINPCASLISTFYSKISLIVSVNDYVVELNEVSYVSTAGIDDSCCGTYDSPCASFNGVLERMGRKGKVYFRSGYYFLSQGFGKLIDVDWDVIGLGDVIIDGIDGTLFDIISSSLTIHNLIVYHNTVLFEILNSSIIFDFVTVQSVSNNSLFLIDKSIITLTQCDFVIDSFLLFDCLESLLFIDNSVFSGVLSDSLISLSSSSVLVDNSIFTDLNTENLVVSSSSSIEFSHSSITEVNSKTIFQLDQSDIVLNYLTISSVFAKNFVYNSFGTIALHTVEVDLSIFTSWFILMDCKLNLHYLNLSGVQGDVFTSVNSKDVIISLVSVVNSSFSNFLNTVNSELSINSLSLSNCTGSILESSVNGSITTQNLKITDSLFDTLFLLSDSSLSLSLGNIGSSSFNNSTLVFYNSTLGMEEVTIDLVSTSIFLESKESTSTFENIIIRNYDFLQFLVLTRSKTNFFQFFMSVCQFYMFKSSAFDIISIESYLTLETSILSGCVSYNHFKLGLYLEKSCIYLLDFDKELFFSSLILNHSNITIMSFFPVIAKSFSIDDESIVLGNAPLLDLSKLIANISISPSQHCCNTSHCKVSLNFNNIEYLSELLELSVPNNDEFFHEFLLNSLDFYLNDIISFNSLNNSIYLNLTVSRVFSFHHLFIPICPIEFVSLEPPTRGGFVPLFAFNLGLDPIVILHSTAPINQSLAYSSNNHEILNLFFFEGRGCHEMVLSRSTDSSIISFDHCFKKPVILSVSTDPFHLHGHISIYGSDFSTSFEYFSLSFRFSQVVINNFTHDEISLYIPYICDINSDILNIYLIVGNQTSNLFQLNLAPPQASYLPAPPLSPSGGINSANWALFFKNLSVQSATYEIIDEDELQISTSDLYGITEFVILVEFFPQFTRLISIPVTSFVSNNTEYVCFVGIPCTITVYSFQNDFSFIDTFIGLNSPNSLHISNYQVSPSFAKITFTSFISTVPNELSICIDSACYSIFNLPFIVSPSYIYPKYIQWFERPVTHSLSIEIEGIDSYGFSVIQRCFSFSNSASQLLTVDKSTLYFEVEFTRTGNYTLQSLSFGHLSEHLSVEIGNFVIFPPIVYFNSVVECYLLESVDDIFVTSGSNSFLLNPGVNILNIESTSTWITLYSLSESVNISTVSSFPNENIPSSMEVNVSQTIQIEIADPNYLYSIACSDDCQLSTVSGNSYRFEINFVGLKVDNIEVSFTVMYFQANFNFVHRVSVHQPPVLELLSSSVISLANPQTIVFSYSGDFYPDSLFLANNVVVHPTEVNDISSSNFALTYVFNISSLNFSKGQSYHHWSWKQSGFSLQHVGVIVVFDIEASSTDFVSPFEHRTIFINVGGVINSNLTCSIESRIFLGVASNNSLSCEDVIISTYYEFVELELSFDGVLINSVLIQGEAFLEDVCFVSFAEHPRINFTTTYTNNLIFNGVRCCNVDVSFCSEFISQFDSINIVFDSSYDVFQIVITTNTSCFESYNNLSFELIANNQTLSPFIFL
ncbi:hypothetical protein GEMRC1_009398 [Eukaryota sp. GEM-RC1]